MLGVAALACRQPCFTTLIAAVSLFVFCRSSHSVACALHPRMVCQGLMPFCRLHSYCPESDGP